jgi:CheY-like chemotaxis protein
MDFEGTAKLLEGIARIIEVLLWPAIIAYLLIRYGSNIGKFISDSIAEIAEITFKAFGVEASVKRRQQDAVAALAAANISRPEQDSTPEAAANATRKAVELVGGLSSRAIRRIEGSQVLWVDDQPDGNRYERQSLEALGVHFVLALSTDDALKKVQAQKFDAIISDMGRPSDRRAGYTLLEKLRSADNRTPFIIYSSSRSPEHDAEARSRGAVGYTNRPTELFEMVLSAIQH